MSIFSTIFLMATLVLPIFAAPVPTSQDISVKDANIERSDSFSLSHLLRNTIQRNTVIEAIPSKTPIAAESKREEDVVEDEVEDSVDLDDRDIQGDSRREAEPEAGRRFGGGSRREAEPEASRRFGGADAKRNQKPVVDLVEVAGVKRTQKQAVDLVEVAGVKLHQKSQGPCLHLTT
ncbi:hypothetical protein GMOD_00003718 [Pyrenophora seminiperda CCB06]|uniref:Uncharacterized protein n=1 Tax=Pyrenophora seminiperda CCB06 TaxID=1302712 RepID=A0A3M7MJG0_9PLEO|nr:hypothetical protein GMOD_00003718 [Pyrenophora seminiperda CCB06]